MGWLDLHMHSNVSIDGEFSPKRLIDMCCEEGLNVIALTDHNSVRGINIVATYAGQQGLRLIPGIELDCTFKGVDLHVLGYGIDPTGEAFEKVEQDVLARERSASAKRIERIRELDIAFDDDEVMKLACEGIVTGEMIAEAALNDDRNRGNPLLRPFYPGGTRSDNPYVNFYWDFVAQGKAAYVPVKFMDLAEAIALIRSSGGISVLAHPGNNVKDQQQLLDEIIKSGIDGLEVYSSYHSLAQTQFYANQAAKHGLLKTLGSDFHGKTKPSIKLGEVYCDDSNERIYQELLEQLKPR